MSESLTVPAAHSIIQAIQAPMPPAAVTPPVEPFNFVPDRTASGATGPLRSGETVGAADPLPVGEGSSVIFAPPTTGPLRRPAAETPLSTGPLDSPYAYVGSTENTTRLSSSGGTGPLSATGRLGSTRILGSTGNTGPLLHTGPLRTGPFDSSVLADGGNQSAIGQPQNAAGRPVPRGALELLPQEAVAYQLGALYLTTKRVILLAPTVIRSAFIRDIDAVGTFTERASGWYLFSGLLLIALAVGAVYASVARYSQNLDSAFPFFYYLNPLVFAALFVAGALAFLVRYFLHVKRTLFVSVKGRPLITVSISDWNTRKLEGMDAFVNAFFQIKDHYQTGELAERSGEYR